MRARFIRPDFFTDEKIGDLPFGARLLFIAIWTHTDLRGVFECNVAQLKIKAFPYDSEVTREKVGLWLEMLAKAGVIVPFESEGKTWGHVKNWSRHQTFTTSEQKAGSRNPEPPSGSSQAQVRHESDQGPTHASSLTLTLTPALTPTPPPPRRAGAREDSPAADGGVNGTYRGVSIREIHRVIKDLDPVGLARAFGSDVSNGLDREWRIDLTGTSASECAAVFLWATETDGRIRKPRGFRTALAVWKDKDDSFRNHWKGLFAAKFHWTPPTAPPGRNDRSIGTPVAKESKETT